MNVQAACVWNFRGLYLLKSAIDGSVDFSGRKNEPILFGIRGTTDLRLCGFFRKVLQVSHFIELEECGCFVHRFIGLGVAAVRFQLLVGDHFLTYLLAYFRFLITTAGRGKAGAAGSEPGWDRDRGVAGIGDAGTGIYFCEW